VALDQGKGSASQRHIHACTDVVRTTHMVCSVGNRARRAAAHRRGCRHSPRRRGARSRRRASGARCRGQNSQAASTTALLFKSPLIV
jgi:hypothetical protein